MRKNEATIGTGLCTCERVRITGRIGYGGRGCGGEMDMGGQSRSRGTVSECQVGTDHPGISSGMRGRRGAAIWVAIVVVAALVRIAGQGTRCLWFDEGVSIHMARFFTLRAEAQDAHPPLYYGLLSVWQLPEI